MFPMQVIYYNWNENTVSLHAWCKFGSKTWDVPCNEVWVWVCQICVWLHLKLAQWLNITGKEYVEVSSYAIAENVTNKWLTAWAVFSVCVAFGHLSAVWEGWHVWSPKPHFMCCSWNVPSCKREATIKCISCPYLSTRHVCTSVKKLENLQWNFIDCVLFHT